MNSMAGSLHLLTQFISSHGLHFLFEILLILSSKKMHFVLLTIFLNFFQSSRLWNCQYLLISVQQSLFHHALECLVILMYLEYLNQILLILKTSTWTMFSKASMLWIWDMSICLTELASSSMKWFFSLLFLIRDHFFIGIHSSNIKMLTVIGM